MEFDFPSVIVDLNSSQIRAGVSVTDLPSTIIPTVYSKINQKDQKKPQFIFDDDIDSHPDADIYTLFNNGVMYNWESVPDLMRYIYKDLHVSKNIHEMPLVIAENAWTPNKNKAKSLEIAFEDLEVPIFSVLKRQICTAYSLSKPNAVVVVDINDDVVSVTPITNGKVLSKGMVKSKYGGNFLSLFSMGYINSQLKLAHCPTTLDDALVARPFQGTNIAMSDSFKRYQIGKTLRDFKESILGASLYNLDPNQQDVQNEDQMVLGRGAGTIEKKNYELPNKLMIKDITIDQYKLAEPLMRPYEYSKVLDPQNGMGVPRDAHGVGSLIFASMKKLAGTGEMYANLLNNIVITGTASSIPQLEQRIIQELRMFVQNYSLSAYLAPDVIERNSDAWVGANILTSSSVADFDHLFVSKQEYEESGENALAKFK